MPKIDVRKVRTPRSLHYVSVNDAVVETVVGRMRRVTPAGSAFGGQSVPFCRMERTIVARILRGAKIDKAALMRQFRFPGRMVNTAITLAQGMIDSARQCAALELENLTERIGQKLGEYLFALSDPERAKEFPGRQRHLEKLVYREARAEQRLASPSIFVGRRFYEHQDRKKWKRDYALARSNHIGCVGSSDETAGNSTLQVTLGPVEIRRGKPWQGFNLHHKGDCLGSFRLLSKECEPLTRAVQANSAPRTATSRFIWLDAKGKKIQPLQVAKMKARGEKPAGRRRVSRVVTEGRVPLTVILRRQPDGKRYVHITYSRRDLSEALIPTGVMGIDLNADFVASVLMRMENGEPLILFRRTDYFSPGLSRGQRRDRLFAIVNDLVDEARRHNLAISLEYLDFEYAKKAMKSKLRALLHVMPYRAIRRLFERRCLKAGVLLRYVKPEYSSLLGAIVSQRWPQLGRDQAAALVIALRPTPEGNSWLEQACRRTVSASSVFLRLNAKGSFGHNVEVCWKRTAARQMDSVAPVPDEPSVHRWQRQCGRQIKTALSTLSGIRSESLRERARDTAARRDLPPLKLPRRLVLEPAATVPCSTLSKAT